MKSMLKIAGGIILAFVLIVGGCSAMSAGSVDDDEPTTRASEGASAGATLGKSSAKPTVEPAPESTAPEPDPEPARTRAQDNAIGAAESYIAMTAFSRKGLIEQLEYEGYATADAEFAVDHIAVNWREQAARAAEAYLDMTSFSRQGLIDQLVYEGYTRKQAEYGVSQTGL